jgi:prepilin-type processing-associated H-X9-DG protein
VFPTGGGSNSGNPSTATGDFSWSYFALPYIEQEPLFRLGPANPTQVITNATTLNSLDKTVVPLYYCPIRRQPRLYHNDAICDYAGNAGSNRNTGANGVIVRNQNNVGRVRMVMISDGTSNTLLVGERRINLQLVESGSDDSDNEPCLRPAWDGDAIRVSTEGGVPIGLGQDVRDATTMFGGGATGLNQWQFGSSHDTGMNSLMCDGSVRIIGFQITPVIFERVCIRNDNKSVGNIE